VRVSYGKSSLKTLEEQNICIASLDFFTSMREKKARQCNHQLFVFVVGLTGPYPRLVKKRPLGTLAGLHVFLSIITQIVLVILFQVGILVYMSTQYW